MSNINNQPHANNKSKLSIRGTVLNTTIKQKEDGNTKKAFLAERKYVLAAKTKIIHTVYKYCK